MILCGMMVCGINCGTLGVKGRMWRVIKKMYESSNSAILLEGEKSNTFIIEQGMTQVVVYPPYYFQYSLMIC